MFTNSKQFKKIVLLSLSISIVGGSAILSLSILGTLCSQVITNVVIYYESMLKQHSPVP